MKFFEDHYKMQEAGTSLQVVESEDTSNFVRKGSLRKVIPGEHNNENLFAKRKEDINKLYRDIQSEYIVLAEYKIVISEDIPGIYVIPSRNNYLAWFGVIFVRNGPYEGGVFRFDLILDPEFPNTTNHPMVKFQSEMFHPAVEPVSNELNVSKAFPKWDKVDTHIWQVLKFTLWVFENVEGSLSYAANDEAVNLFQTNKEEFANRVKFVVAESVDHLYDEPATDDKHYISFEQYNPKIHESTRAHLLTKKYEDYQKAHNSWVAPGSLVPLSRPPTPDSDQDS